MVIVDMRLTPAISPSSSGPYLYRYRLRPLLAVVAHEAARSHLVNDRGHRLATLDEGAAVESVRQHRIATSAAIVVAGIAKRRQAQLLVEGLCHRFVSNLAGIIDGHASWAGPHVLQSDPRVVAAVGIIEDDWSIQRRRPSGRGVVAGELATGSDLVDDRGQRTAGALDAGGSGEARR